MHALNSFNIYLNDGTLVESNTVPTLEIASKIEKIEVKQSDEAKILKDLEIIIPCDVNNSLLGPNGAVYVFGP